MSEGANTRETPCRRPQVEDVPGVIQVETADEALAAELDATRY
jgi:hypothetical protein